MIRYEREDISKLKYKVGGILSEQRKTGGDLTWSYDTLHNILLSDDPMDVYYQIKNLDLQENWAALSHVIFWAPLKDMPLFINSHREYLQLVARWRLEIGK